MSAGAVDRRRVGPARLLTMAIGLGLGLTMLVASFPTLMGALHALPGDRWLSRLKSGSGLTPSAADILGASRENALRWDDDPRYLSDRALAETLSAELQDLPREDEEALLQRAEADLEESLGRAPARPHAWVRLAQVRLMLDPAHEGIAPALRMAVRTAPYRPRVALAMANVGWSAWPNLEEETRELVIAQVHRMWAHYPDRWPLIEMALESGRLNMLQRTLLPGFQRLEELEIMLKQLKKRGGRT